MRTIRFYFLYILLSLFLQVIFWGHAQATPFRGSYLFTYLGFSIYKARLFMDDKCDDFDCSFKLSLTYFRDLKGDALAERSIEEMNKQKKLSLKVSEQRVKILKTIFPDVQENDVIIGVYDQGKAKFYFNSKFIGQIDDKEFARDFFGIWLSEKTSEPDMRASLLKLQEK